MDYDTCIYKHVLIFVENPSIATQCTRIITRDTRECRSFLAQHTNELVMDAVRGENTVAPHPTSTVGCNER